MDPRVPSAHTVIDAADRLVLGTAQLAADYGIANIAGAPTRSEALALLEYAWEAGIRRFDTAPAYGSEALIGEFVAAHGIANEIIVLTKIPAVDPARQWRDEIKSSVEGSLSRVGSAAIEVLFFHRSADSRWMADDPLFFQRLISELPIKQLGLSVYEPADLVPSESAGFEIACQFPSNLFDTRFENVKIAAGRRYARSVFLQGVLASAGAIRSCAPAGLVKLHRRYHGMVANKGLDPVALALSAVIRRAWIDFVLFGVERIEQLKMILGAALYPDPESFVSEFMIRNAQCWLDPRRW